MGHSPSSEKRLGDLRKTQKTSKAGSFKNRLWRVFGDRKEAVHAFSRVVFLARTSIDAGFAGRR